MVTYDPKEPMDPNPTYHEVLMYDGENTDQIIQFLESRVDVLRAFKHETDDRFSLEPTVTDDKFLVVDLWTDEDTTTVTLEPYTFVSDRPGLEFIKAIKTDEKDHFWRMEITIDVVRNRADYYFRKLIYYHPFWLTEEINFLTPEAMIGTWVTTNPERPSTTYDGATQYYCQPNAQINNGIFQPSGTWYWKRMPSIGTVPIYDCLIPFDDSALRRETQ